MIATTRADKRHAHRHLAPVAQQPDTPLQDGPAVPAGALDASLRYFSQVVEAQDARLAARQQDLHALTVELSQRQDEIEQRSARIAELEAQLCAERAERDARDAAGLAGRARALAGSPRLHRLLRHLPQPVRRLLRWAKQAVIAAPATAPERPAPASSVSPAPAATLPDYRERMRALLAEGRLQRVKQLTILVPPAMADGARAAIVQCLSRVGLHGKVRADSPEAFTEDFYLVVSPGALGRLPPAERSIVWLPEAGDEAGDEAGAIDAQALAYLASSVAIFDGSLARIDALQGRGIALQQIFYLPLQASARDDDSPMGQPYLLARALHGCGLLATDAFEQATRHIRLDAERIVLCMPESAQRFSHAKAGLRHGAVLFPGIRQLEGWHGTALSYRHLARAALAAGRRRLIVWEDDASLPPDLEPRLQRVLAHLDEHEGDWDLFSGLLTDLSESSKVRAMALREGELFLRLDTMVGMVFTIYGPWALQKLAAYRIEGDDVLRHTIDRYLEALKPRCFTVFPPLVQHDDALGSTLWQRADRRFVTNEFMNAMIHRSQGRLVAKMIRCLQRGG